MAQTNNFKLFIHHRSITQRRPVYEEQSSQIITVDLDSLINDKDMQVVKGSIKYSVQGADLVVTAELEPKTDKSFTPPKYV